MALLSIAKLNIPLMDGMTSQKENVSYSCWEKLHFVSAGKDAR